MRAIRRQRWLAYLMSLFILGAAAWLPHAALAQVMTGDPTGSSSGGISFPVSDEVFRVCDNADTTKCVEFELTGMTTGNTLAVTFTGTAAAPKLDVGGLRVGITGVQPEVRSSGNGINFIDIAENTFVIGGGYGSALAANSQYGWGSVNDDANGSAIDTGWGRFAAGVAVLRDDTASSIRSLAGGGAAVASAAALPLPTGRIFHVTGTTTITSITSTNFESGAVITLIFDGILTFTDGSNLVIAGNFVTTASDTITLAYDGTSWHEIGRAVN